jgi:O-antigen/teichoic acid export membrane protein
MEVVAALQLSMVAGYGVPQALTPALAAVVAAPDRAREFWPTVTTGFGILFALGAVTAIVGVILAGPVARLVNGDNGSVELEGALRVVAVTLPVLVSTHGVRAALHGCFAYADAGILDVCLAIGLASAALIGAHAGWTLTTVAAWVALVHALVCAAGFFMLHHRAPRIAVAGSIPVRSALARSLGRYSLWAWMATLASQIFGSVDRLVVGALLGPVAAGFYAVCTSVGDRLTQLAAPFTRVLVPYASATRAAPLRINGDAVRLYAVVTILVSWTLAAAGSTLILFDDVALTRWLGLAATSEAMWTFRGVVLIYATFSMAATPYQFALGAGGVRGVALLGLVGAGASLAGIALLGREWGLPGAAAGNLPYVLVIATHVLAARSLGVSWRAGFAPGFLLPLAPLMLALGVRAGTSDLTWRVLALACIGASCALIVARVGLQNASLFTSRMALRPSQSRAGS